MAASLLAVPTSLSKARSKADFRNRAKWGDHCDALVMRVDFGFAEDPLDAETQERACVARDTPTTLRHDVGTSLPTASAIR